MTISDNNLLHTRGKDDLEASNNDLRSKNVEDITLKPYFLLMLNIVYYIIQLTIIQ